MIDSAKRASLRDLARRAHVLRDQIIAVACVIALVDVLWIFAVVAWWHHHSGRTTLASISLVGMLACAIALSRHLRREQSEALAAIRRALHR